METLFGRRVHLPGMQDKNGARRSVQGLTLSVFANNGYMATTDAHEFRVQ